MRRWRYARAAVCGSPEALLITGPYGAGKSLLAATVADELERRGVRFAAVDLDWLAWFDPGDDPATAQRIFLANLRAVVANYRSIGITWFVFAGRSRRAMTSTRSLRPPGCRCAWCA